MLPLSLAPNKWTAVHRYSFSNGNMFLESGFSSVSKPVFRFSGQADEIPAVDSFDSSLPLSARLLFSLFSTAVSVGSWKITAVFQVNQFAEHHITMHNNQDMSLEQTNVLSSRWLYSQIPDNVMLMELFKLSKLTLEMDFFWLPSQGRNVFKTQISTLLAVSSVFPSKRHNHKRVYAGIS